MTTRKRVTIMIGCPGSGKSTWIKNNESPDAVVVSADHWFIQANGEYVFDPNQLGAAHADCMRRFREALANPDVEAIVVDNTNTSRKAVKPYLDAATAAGAITIGMILQVDPAVAAARNVHGVPLETIERMAKEVARFTSSEEFKSLGFDFVGKV